MTQPVTEQKNNAEVQTITIDIVVASLNHRQRAALVSKYEALKKPIKDAMQEKFSSMSKLEQYIASKLHDEANARITSEKMPSWRGTMATFAPDLESKNETLRKAAEARLDSLRDEMDTADATVDVVKWYKVKTDSTSKDAHIQRVCDYFGVDPSSIA